MWRTPSAPRPASSADSAPGLAGRNQHFELQVQTLRVVVAAATAHAIDNRARCEQWQQFGAELIDQFAIAGLERQWIMIVQHDFAPHRRRVACVRSRSLRGTSRLERPQRNRDGTVGDVQTRLPGASQRTGLTLSLVKHVPSQAGLGGASSDAAAAWLASERALGIMLAPMQRSSALARLGSDCVFFSEANATGFARCQGRGERVEVHTLPDALPLVAILAPSVLSPTPRVYAALTQPLSAPRALPRVRAAWFDNPVSAARSALHNRLESAALRAVPELVSWRALLDAHGAEHFRLAGSGSCFFGLFDDPAEATRALDRIVVAAAGQGLACRGHWVTRPARRGATIL